MFYVILNFMPNNLKNVIPDGVTPSGMLTFRVNSKREFSSPVFASIMSVFSFKLVEIFTSSKRKRRTSNSNLNFLIPSSSIIGFFRRYSSTSVGCSKFKNGRKPKSKIFILSLKNYF